MTRIDAKIRPEGKRSNFRPLPSRDSRASLVDGSLLTLRRWMTKDERMPKPRYFILVISLAAFALAEITDPGYNIWRGRPR
jgi:hypothetical protein